MSESAMLTRDRIFAIPNFGFHSVAVAVPEWDGLVHVRTISRTEADAFDASLPNASARFAVLVACDPAGKRLFSDDDAAELGRHWKKPIDRIVLAGRKLNGLDADSVDAAEKN